MTTTRQVGQKIVYAGERHMLLFGPNGTGKGTRFLKVERWESPKKLPAKKFTNSLGRRTEGIDFIIGPTIETIKQARQWQGGVLLGKGRYGVL
jgi:hypothetical protein